VPLPSRKIFLHESLFEFRLDGGKGSSRCPAIFVDISPEALDFPKKSTFVAVENDTPIPRNDVGILILDPFSFSGSTRWAWTSTRDSVEGARSLEINRLHREGCLPPGYSGGREWTRTASELPL
jgi:hypothetical protein